MELDFAKGLLFALGLSYSDPHVIFQGGPWFGLLRQVIGCRSLVACSASLPSVFLFPSCSDA